MKDNKWLPVAGEECQVYYKDGRRYVEKVLVNYVGDKFLVGRMLLTESEIALAHNSWDFKPIVSLKSETIEKVKNKFKVGDVVKHKSDTSEHTILFIDKVRAVVVLLGGDDADHNLMLISALEEYYEKVIPIRVGLADILSGLELELYSSLEIADMILEEFDVKEKS